MAASLSAPVQVHAGELVRINLTVSNTGSWPISGIVADLHAVSGSIFVAPVGGPAPPGPVSLPFGSATTFQWTFRATGIGVVAFDAIATGVDTGSGLLISAAASGASIVVTGSSVRPQLRWTTNDVYSESGVHPATGNRTVTFHYSVTYLDQDGNAPRLPEPRVHILKGGTEIQGSPFGMSLGSGDFINGSICSYSMRLPSPGMDYEYFFEAHDTFSATATGAPTQRTAGPVVEFVADIADVRSKIALGRILVAPNALTLRMMREGAEVAIFLRGEPSESSDLRLYDEAGETVKHWTVVLDGEGYGRVTSRDVNDLLRPGAYFAVADGGGVRDRKTFVVTEK